MTVGVAGRTVEWGREGWQSGREWRQCGKDDNGLARDLLRDERYDRINRPLDKCAARNWNQFLKDS